MKTTRKDLTTGEVARYCQTSLFTVSIWIKTGKLRAYRTPGGHRRIRWDDFQDFLTTYQLPMPDEVKIGLDSSPRILVVDDDPGVKDMLTQLLRQEGFEVHGASDGYEAGLRVATFKPHLVILDLVMPHINGFELCAKLKAAPPTRSVKVMAITAYAEEDNIQKAFTAGADICLAKPFHTQHLLQEIHRLLNWNDIGNHDNRGVERRKTRRASLTLPIQYSVSLRRGKRSEKVVGKSETVNVGQGGLMLETMLPLDPSSHLQLEIYLRRGHPPLRVQGEVRWVKHVTDAVQQMGVQFTRMSEEIRKQLVNQLFCY